MLCVLSFSFYIYRPSYYGLWLPDINKDWLTDWLINWLITSGYTHVMPNVGCRLQFTLRLLFQTLDKLTGSCITAAYVQNYTFMASGLFSSPALIVYNWCWDIGWKPFPVYFTSVRNYRNKRDSAQMDYQIRYTYSVLRRSFLLPNRRLFSVPLLRGSPKTGL